MPSQAVCPGFELATWQALISREAFQEPQTVAIKTAKSPLRRREAIMRPSRHVSMFYLGIVSRVGAVFRPRQVRCRVLISGVKK
jgi:hypothetical protein